MPSRPRHYLPNHISLARKLRREQTEIEAELWNYLSNRQLGGYKFRRQQAIGNYVADFFCAECKLIVELDGDSHLDKQNYDRERSEWIEKEGYRVLRIPNEDLREDVDGVLERILKACQEGKDDRRT